MRGLTKGAVLAFGLALGPTAVYAQGAEFSLGGGVAVPTGDFDNAFKMGWQGLAAVSFVPENMPIGFQLDGNYSEFTDESALDIKEQLIYGTANIVYKFKTSEESKFRPYLIGGGGAYNLKLKGDDVVSGSGSDTKFGVNAGAGFDFKLGSAGLFIEGRFHNVFTNGSDAQFVPINAGIRLGGS